MKKQKLTDAERIASRPAIHPAALLGTDPFDFCSSCRTVRRADSATLLERVITIVDRYQHPVTE